MEPFIKQILTSRIYDLVEQTPLDHAKNLSLRTECQVYLKREDLQPVFSFKLRGAHHRIQQLSEEERQRGVICASAGNHAQGVALSARFLGIRAVIVMPRTTPRIKVDAVRRYGAEVILHGDNYSEAAVHCEGIIHERGMTFIHPFDDPLVIAGQGTIGHELLQQRPDLDMVFVPVGGGGLIAGVAGFIKEVRPEVKVIGVEPVESDAMERSLREGRRITLDRVGIFADGVAVKQVGEYTFRMAQRYVDGIVTVTTDQICSAIKSIYEDTRSIVEPAGALAVAGMRRYLEEEGIREAKVVAVNSGANMNFDRLQFVAERTHTGEEREAIFAVTIPEKPGSLKYFCDTFVGHKNITEFNYRMMEGSEAHIFVGIEVSNREERARFCEELRQEGFPCVDLTDNELAKTHVRHMVGGRSAQSGEELLYRFRFPERPGALADFLNAMSEIWNISLFHYRMHGGDYGRVLTGLMIPSHAQGEFQNFLEKLNYTFFDETENEAYRLFL